MLLTCPEVMEMRTLRTIQVVSRCAAAALLLMPLAVRASSTPQELAIQVSPQCAPGTPHAGNCKLRLDPDLRLVYSRISTEASRSTTDTSLKLPANLRLELQGGDVFLRAIEGRMIRLGRIDLSAIHWAWRTDRLSIQLSPEIQARLVEKSVNGADGRACSQTLDSPMERDLTGIVFTRAYDLTLEIETREAKPKRHSLVGRGVRWFDGMWSCYRAHGFSSILR